MFTVRQVQLTDPGRYRLATGEEFGFLLVFRGSASVNGLWNLGMEDLLICKPDQSAQLEFSGGRIPLKALWIRISLEQMRSSSGPQTDIPASFQVNPAPIVRVRSQSPQLLLMKNLANQLLTLPEDPLAFGSDLMEQSSVQMFLALALRVCVLEDPHRKKQARRGGSPLSLDEVFSYIHTHLTEDLSLERLEQEFYVSRHHLIREFKKRTGQTVHQYIVKARLELSRRYIEQGYSISEVYRMGGFAGYNHFFRAFRQAYGMTPKQYYQSLREHGPG